MQYGCKVRIGSLPWLKEQWRGEVREVRLLSITEERWSKFRVVEIKEYEDG